MSMNDDLMKVAEVQVKRSLEALAIMEGQSFQAVVILVSGGTVLGTLLEQSKETGNLLLKDAYVLPTSTTGPDPYADHCIPLITVMGHQICTVLVSQDLVNELRPK